MHLSQAIITPYILAGGKSTRMGMDKRLMMLHGMTLLDRSFLLAETATGKEPTLVGNNLTNWERQGYRVIADAIPDSGPLGGIVAALQDCQTEWAMVLPIDMPALRAEILTNMMILIASDIDVIVLGKRGFIEPLVALYCTSKLNFWKERLMRNILSPVKGIWELNHRIYNVPSPENVLKNLNRPQDVIQ